MVQTTERGRMRKTLEKVVDVKEAKTQITYALPMIFTNVFYNLIPVISVMFAGHVGQLQLAGSTLANSWATVTGIACMVSFFSSPFILYQSYIFSYSFWTCLILPLVSIVNSCCHIL